MVDRTVLAAKLAAVRDAARLGSAAGLRNVIAHRYGAVDWERIHRVATSDLDDLLRFCETIARKANASA